MGDYLCEMCSGRSATAIEHGQEVNSTTSRIRQWTPDTLECDDCGTVFTVDYEGVIDIVSTDLDAMQDLFKQLRKQ